MIITISREFGSGGRELGKRLADALGIPCYDHQIIDMVAEKEKLNRDYVSSMSEKDIKVFYPTTIGCSFAGMNYALRQSMSIAVAEHDLLRELAEMGDCVIIGRAADVVLAERRPFNIFVCADDASKLRRCRARERSDEQLTDREILRKCRSIDKQRRAYHSAYSPMAWGSAAGYHLCINTSGQDIKTLIPPLVAYLEAWQRSEPIK